MQQTEKEQVRINALLAKQKEEQGYINALLTSYQKEDLHEDIDEFLMFSVSEYWYHGQSVENTMRRIDLCFQLQRYLRSVHFKK